MVNDNGYAISPGFGAIHNHLQSRAIGAEGPDPLFSALGYKSIGPVDGHSIYALLDAIDEGNTHHGFAYFMLRPKKVEGCHRQKLIRSRCIFIPFDPDTGALKAPPPSPSCQDIAALAIGECVEANSHIVAITPSTLYATGLSDIFTLFPERCFDPGMEEQHAVSMAVGIALSGSRPVLFYQSTFLQRAFDQLIHDVCFANQDILILAVRSGFAGYDNPTHHGIYDLSYLRCLPNLTIYYPQALERFMK